jgi:hypothetical protein
LIALALFMLHWWQYLAAFPGAIRRATRQRDALTAACLVGCPIMAVCAALANVLLLYSFWAVSGLALACLNVLRHEEHLRQQKSLQHGQP